MESLTRANVAARRSAREWIARDPYQRECALLRSAMYAAHHTAWRSARTNQTIMSC